jgi:hypothetical protein
MEAEWQKWHLRSGCCFELVPGTTLEGKKKPAPKDSAGGSNKHTMRKLGTRYDTEK